MRGGCVATSDSVTTWIGKLREGDAAAAQHLWERYFVRLVAVARAKLRGISRQATDEEDVALSAFYSFCRAASRFPRLNSRDDLWQVLLMLTARKAYRERRRQLTQKRGGQATVDGRRTVTVASLETTCLDEIIGTEPDPEFALLIADQLQFLMKALPDDTLRAVARWRLEELTNTEIALRLQCSERTVERKLVLIRGYWEKTVEA